MMELDGGHPGHGSRMGGSRQASHASLTRSFDASSAIDISRCRIALGRSLKKLPSSARTQKQAHSHRHTSPPSPPPALHTTTAERRLDNGLDMAAAGEIFTTYDPTSNTPARRG